MPDGVMKSFRVIRPDHVSGLAMAHRLSGVRNRIVFGDAFGSRPGHSSK